ncbi:MAG: class I SAM-dependent methyltransferase [Myxococcota bacterium]
MKILAPILFVVLLGGCTAPRSPSHPMPPHGHGGNHGSSDTAHAHGGHHHRFDDATKWAARFEDPKRDEWQKPDAIIEALELPPDANVADIGAATGYFPVRLAKTLPEGHVWGVDIEVNMVSYLKERAHKEGYDNLSAILATPDDPHLPEPMNAVLVVDTYHHIDNRSAYFRNLRKQLRPGGIVAIVDFRKGELPFGPPDSAKLAPEVVENEFKEAGYRLKSQHDFLEYQYFLIFEPIS